MMQKGLIDVTPLITHKFGLDDAIDAFEMAKDRSQAMKVQIAFT
jgi:L-idonate 5-dehydrogenase